MRNSKANIIPVFYHVKPADLRWTQSESAGIYGQSLRKLEEKKTYDSERHEEKPRHDPSTVQQWRDALSSVANISGFELERYNGDEGKMVDAVVECVVRKIVEIIYKNEKESICWEDCLSSSLPPWILKKNLKVLEVHGSLLKTLWNAECEAPLQLRELKIRSPLSKIPKSIGQLQYLEEIHLSYENLEILALPEEFCHLRSLKTLELVNCTEMKSLPDSFGNLTNLESIKLTYAKNLESLPKSFGNLVRLQYLELKGCSNVTISSEALQNITKLDHIDLCACAKLEELPPQVAMQESLEKLYLWGTNFKTLPNDIVNLSNLKILQIESPLLETLPTSIGELSNLEKLTVWNCEVLKSLPDSVVLLTRLTKLNVCRCKELEKLPSIDEFSSLKKLLTSRCVKLKSIRGFGQVTTLKKLDVRKCFELKELEGVEHCVSLEEVTAYGCPRLQWGDGAVEQLRQRLKELFVLEKQTWKKASLK